MRNRLAYAACLMLPVLAGAAPPAGTAASVTWFLGGSSGELPSCFSCEASLAPAGTSSFGTLGNPANDQLSPAVETVASSLSVHLETAPGGSAKRTFFLFARASGKSLKCEIAGAATSCDSGTQTLTIPAASKLVIDVAITGDGPPMRAQYSWRATTP